MLQKKIAMLGAPGVGKTSLVRRYVESLFDETYLTTIGVKIDKKVVHVREQAMTLVVWDIAGEEERFSVPSSYVRGAAGYLLVADGTRPETLAVAFEIAGQVEREIGRLPYVLVLNKSDLADRWRLNDADAWAAADAPVDVLRASAKTNEGVEEAFARLAAAVADF